jgi:hypothetical protein
LRAQKVRGPARIHRDAFGLLSRRFAESKNVATSVSTWRGSNGSGR